MNLHYDAGLKLRIRQAIYDDIYGLAETRFKETLQDIIERNSDIHKNEQHCFKYKGHIYTNEAFSKIPRPINWLDQSLYTEMDKYLNSLEEMRDVEMPYVLGYLNKVLRATESFQDYYQLFPSSIHPILKRIEDTCPCKQSSLSEDSVTTIKSGNEIAINKIHKRMTMNMIM
jgi:hypothetical protein